MTEKRTRLKLKKGDRYDPAQIADRLEGLRKLARVEPKEIGQHLWPNQKPDNAARTWYKRANQYRIPFSLPEIQKIVDYLADAAAKIGVIRSTALPGFPFVDLYVAIRIESGEGPRPKA